MSELDYIRVVTAFCFFIYASISDLKTRRVKDGTWVLMGVIALSVFELDLVQQGSRICAQSLLIVCALLFFDIFWDREKGPSYARYLGYAVYAACFVWTVYIAYMVLIGTIEWSWVVGPFMCVVMIFLFELFYMLDVIKGGADAKGLICLALLFPAYPALLTSLPLIAPTSSITDFFTLSLSVLFVGALLTLAIPLMSLVRNVRAGNGLSLRALVGFLMPIQDVEGKFVWLMEWVEEGEVRFSSRRFRDSDLLKEDIAALKEIGREKVWVTHKIPFIIPMTMGMAIVLVVGNPLFLVY